MDNWLSECRRALEADPENAGLKLRYIQALERLGEAHKGKPLSQWVMDLSAWSNGLRAEALETLRELGPGIKALLYEPLASLDYWARYRSLELLFEFGQPDWTRLRPLLKDPSGRIRAQLVASWPMNEDRSGTLLIEVVRTDDSRYVRWRALERLKMFADAGLDLDFEELQGLVPGMLKMGVPVRHVWKSLLG